MADTPVPPGGDVAATRELAASLDASALAEFATALPDAVLVTDAVANALWANRAAEKLFGISLDDGIGINGLDLIHPDDIQMAMLSLTSVQGKDVGTPLEIRLKAHDGWRLVELIGTPVGELLLLSIRDLTERRRWEVAQNGDERFRSMVHNASMLTMFVTAEGVVGASSSALSRMLGHDQEWLEGRPLADLVAEQDRPTLASALATVLHPGAPAGRPPLTVDLLLRRRDDRTVPFAMTFKNLLDDPTVGGLVVSGHDVTDRTLVEAELREANSVLAATLESTADGILVVDKTGRITSVNRRFIEMWNLPPAAMTGNDHGPAIAFAMTQLRDPDAFESKLRNLYDDLEVESHDVLEFLDGRIFERDSMPQRIDGEVVGRVWSFRDVTAHKVLQDELTRQAFHDALTGLANQALFRDRVDHAVARLERTGGRLAVLFIDLDDFKTVNDSLGHTVGDELLVAVSDRLGRYLRPADTAARLGGDEFAVLIEDLDDETHAVGVAERIVAALREPVALASKLVTVSASVGIAFGSAGAGEDGQALLRNADLAMYTAKGRGKNGYRVFAPEMHQAAVERLEIESSLRGAAERGELVVHYQPIYEVDGGRISAVEALVRWQHPERGLLGPGAFIALAEESGLIDEIGDHVLVTSLHEVGRWRLSAGDAAPAVNVNLSPHQLLDPGLPERVAEHLADAGVEAQYLILEITEGALMADPIMAAQNLRRLRDAGVRLAVDDFGTGYSSLAYLQQFPIDFLKVDGSFVAAMSDRPDACMVDAIVQLSHTLGLVPIAEGVETQEQADRLALVGCDLAQGYLLARPMPADAVTALLSAAEVGERRESTV